MQEAHLKFSRTNLTVSLESARPYENWWPTGKFHIKKNNNKDKGSSHAHVHTHICPDVELFLTARSSSTPLYESRHQGTNSVKQSPHQEKLEQSICTLLAKWNITVRVKRVEVCVAGPNEGQEALLASSLQACKEPLWRKVSTSLEVWWPMQMITNPAYPRAGRLEQ